jgi:hypothetical protein
VLPMLTQLAEQLDTLQMYIARAPQRANPLVILAECGAAAFWAGCRRMFTISPRICN